MKNRIITFIGCTAAMIALLFGSSSCGEDSWCSGFVEEPYIVLMNTSEETVMVRTESNGIEQGPFIANRLNPYIVVPINMNSNYIKFYFQKGNEEGEMALEYSFETEYCADNNDYRLQFRSIKPDPKVKSFKWLRWDYHYPPLHDGKTDGAVLHKMRQKDERDLFFPLIFIK
jgi:hypothetical protein